MAPSRQVCTVNHIDHVGIAVSDLEATLKVYEGLFGLKAPEILVEHEQKVRAAFLQAGQVKLELLQGSSPDSVISRFVERRGEGMHHLALNVNNIQEKLDILKGMGVKLVDEKPRKGLSGTIAFLHPGAAHGVLIELVQSK